MRQELWIPGWLPASTNTLLRKHWARRNAALKADAYTVLLWSRQAGTVPAAGSRRVSLTLRLAPQHRKRDPDNLFKSTLDALVRAKLLLDDAPHHCQLGAVTQEKAGDGPWGTLIVNVTGSFVIGFFNTLTGPDGRLLVGGTARQFVMIGVCGGYTTFSSFSLQTLSLAQEGEWLQAGGNILLSVVLCLVAVWLGHILAASLNQLRGA